jgi:sugar lactone lactonase YvrE
MAPRNRSDQPGDETIGELETVHTFDDGPMPTGVSVSATGRIFVNFPKWGDDVPATVVELRDGKAVPYPDEKWNQPAGDDDPTALVSVQSIVVDPVDRLWILDTGSPMFQPTKPGGPKLVGVDLSTDTVVSTITFDPDVALPTTYLNDIRFDLRKGAGGIAYITDSADSGPNGIIVVDLATGDAWRRLHDHPSTKAEQPDTFLPVVEGNVFMERPADGPAKPVLMGADGIAISADGARLWYCPLASRRWYSVSADRLDQLRGARGALATAPRRRGRRDRRRRGGQGRRLRRSGDRRDRPAVRDQRRAQRHPAAGHRRDHRDAGARPPAALARHHVAGRRRPPLRHRQSAAPSVEVPRW